jgi:hypothetical protein
LWLMWSRADRRRSPNNPGMKSARPTNWRENNRLSETNGLRRLSVSRNDTPPIASAIVHRLHVLGADSVKLSSKGQSSHGFPWHFSCQLPDRGTTEK